MHDVLSMAHFHKGLPQEGPEDPGSILSPGSFSFRMRNRELLVQRIFPSSSRVRSRRNWLTRHRRSGIISIFQRARLRSRVPGTQEACQIVAEVHSVPADDSQTLCALSGAPALACVAACLDARGRTRSQRTMPAQDETFSFSATMY